MLIKNEKGLSRPHGGTAVKGDNYFRTLYNQITPSIRPICCSFCDVIGSFIFVFVCDCPTVIMQVIKDLEEFQKILKENGSKLILVDFYATWCGPCKMIAPVLEELSKKHLNVVFCKVDVDEAEDVAQNYEISAMPTFLFFKNGEKIKEVVGANRDEIKKQLEALS